MRKCQGNEIAQMNNIGERIRIERDRLKFNQTEFGNLGGVLVSTQSKYEGNKRKPDSDYLVNVAKIGVDIQFVLTGVRSLNLDMVADPAADYNYPTGEFEDRLKRLAQIRDWFLEIEKENGIEFACSNLGTRLMDLAFRTNLDKRGIQVAYKLLFSTDDET